MECQNLISTWYYAGPNQCNYDTWQTSPKFSPSSDEPDMGSMVFPMVVMIWMFISLPLHYSPFSTILILDEKMELANQCTLTKKWIAQNVTHSGLMCTC
jgi:hypothetical protein